ncbi:PREDICTED: wall-associated receptor kinase-like 20 [Tarenaya hassleriana]|uniref:wall-associated receptor kinase-like 20 n=1 Tax=Tarenaya hassleriana TaxID=28532 RepID=UPI0008FD65F4|nr:PREDICTED: wall-associated receptor kinase-like 20 [Tarenaya hassleriana]
MEKHVYSLVSILFPLLLIFTVPSAGRHPKAKHPAAAAAAGPPRCLNCGPMVVPYPLSTAPNCGDQSYKIRCVLGKLYLDTLHGSSYIVTSINPLTQRVILQPPGLANPAVCASVDASKQGLELDPKLPFSITSSNTVLLFSCPDAMLQAPMDCTADSICHVYAKDNAPACSKAPLCCTFKTGGTQTAYTIRINGGGCSAYQSFVGLDPSKGVPPGKKWPEPGLELQWALPKEPVCKSDADCTVMLAKSKCLADPSSPGLKRCSCKKGLEWDPVNGMCGKCSHGKRCKKKKKTVVFAGAAAAAAVGISLAIAVGVIAYNRSDHKVKKENHKNIVKEREEMLSAKYTGKSARIFTGREIIKATNNFSKDNLIGTGGFGEVFKAVLDDGTITAIKRAKLNNTKGTDQILNEVRILCQVNHRSLVRLLGCCVELEQPLLIYEFIPNGTLFEHLHCNINGKWRPLTWRHRLQIVHQTAEGLAYLHSAAVPPIYHRDVKSSNILLDEKLSAKVSDFGLSRLVDLTETNNESHIFTCAQGTLGYLDPEYYRNFQLTDKSDVYSFGVVLLEILTSKKAIDFTRQEEDVNLVMYMNKMMDEERLMECIDPLLKKTANKVELETMQSLGNLAAACLNERRQNRPSMKEVADEIGYIISILTREVSEAQLS